MSILDTFLGKSAPKNQTSEQIGDALSKARATLVDEQRTLADRTRKRATVLLEGTDSDLAKHDATTDSAQRGLDRTQAAVAHLEELLREAKIREAEAGIVARALEAEDAAARYAENLEKYGELAEAMVEVLNSLQEDELLVSQIRQELREDGYSITEPNHLLRPTNQPVYEVAVVPAASEDGASFPPSSAEVRFRKPREEYSGPVHELPPEPAGVFDGEGHEVQGGGRLVGGRRRS